MTARLFCRLCERGHIDRAYSCLFCGWRCHFRRDWQSYFPGCSPFRSPCKRELKTLAAGLLRAVPERGHEDPSFAVFGVPAYRLMDAGTGNGLTGAAVIQRVIIVSRRKHVITAFRLPAQVGVQLVFRNRERLQTASDRMLGILEMWLLVPRMSRKSTP